MEPPLCPLCLRPFGSIKSRHHLVPACEGGKETVPVHRVCHDFLHATFHENELRDTYNTAEKLRVHPDVARFVKWVSGEPLDFHSPSKRRVGRMA